jgi:hypothetical protein
MKFILCSSDFLRSYESIIIIARELVPYPTFRDNQIAVYKSKVLRSGKTIDNMSYLAYYFPMSPHDKPLVWMHGEITTPPFSDNARIETGYLLRQLQKGSSLSLPQSRPMPSI